MKPITVPRITANEDVVQVVEVAAGQNEACSAGDLLCVLQSTKTTYELTAEADGHVWFTTEPGAGVTVGQTIGWTSPELIDPSAIPTSADSPSQTPGGTDRGVIVTRKAAELLARHGISATSIRTDGVLRASEVEAFVRGRDDAAKPPDSRYAELERVMKSAETGDVSVADIARLKQTLELAASLYAERWDRQIPSLDVLFDRWAAGSALGFGERSNISHLSYVIGDVKVGRGTFVGPFTVLDGGGGLTIGDFCSIAAGVHVYSHDTIGRALSGYRMEASRAPTRIGSACFIGPHSVVAKGVTIGDHCFVGANSVVTADVPSYTAVQGNPARVIGRVEVSDDGRVQIVPVQRHEAPTPIGEG